ncbi:MULTISPECIES: hypothetical protein [unclassified Rhizobacter]|uniref:hypothetical protein n=1 Tax=unclassified Rhizobacter TaxID=2640088 RepID=UPI0007002EDE|nr:MULTISPECIES: hypothetical protein [unclassified Rhizobacter]KQU74978.1 hypothetical protein ASC88_26565 [Rhizobacter sp. Root29]KQW00947.1 hypothetical protein ASC98_06400 [Rhizobacter sp. Root1238]KRB03797.1 hypothetical protein ASE08_13905 [Rhizobacter sp. Root16D2]
MSTPAELRIATRIHFGLKQWLGEGIDVEVMLRQPDEAREILFVCQASGNAELQSLARQWADASTERKKAARPRTTVDKPAARTAAPKAPEKTTPARAAARQDLAWARDTSGFGITQPAELAPPEPDTAGARWHKPSSWLRLVS